MEEPQEAEMGEAVQVGWIEPQAKSTIAPRPRKVDFAVRSIHPTIDPQIRHDEAVAIESAMIAEHDYAVLTRDLPDLGLAAGDVGVVVHIHRRPGEDEAIGYMLELITVDGQSVDEVSVPADAVR